MSDVNEKKTELELSEEFLDAVYDEMINFSALDTTFIDSVLELSKDEDEIYENVVRWFRSEHPMERKHYESLLQDLLAKFNRA